MKKYSFIPILVLVVLFSAFKTYQYYDINVLREQYSSGDYTQWPAPDLDSITAINFQDIGHLDAVVHPETNPYSKEKRELGKTLFFDPRLSSSGQIACASCHDSEIGWNDGRRTSYGHNRQLGRRNSMTILNVAYAEKLFWDGRSGGLEDQVNFPIKDSLEMNFHINLAVDTISKIEGYKALFEKAFGTSQISEQRIRKAIATFERSIVSESTKFDKFISGNSEVYSDEEVLGLHLFRTKARCINCHNSGYFSDNQFHNTGLTYYGRPFEDLGLYEVTGKKEDVGKFKTSSLREISRTRPYMHNGLFPHLEGVVNMYNAGMPQPKRKAHQLNDTLFPTTSPILKALQLTVEEKGALVAFLETLESRRHRESPPELPM
ncbi:cytochrome-c peroxidase [Aestuariibaculum lutulentum]|uniref:Cytochrome-c peroxidase n=1 Tax=Aestuariibaculum lutulentum TaxID=2920935 RepID=A0ABS9RHF7_9FLAO|nr:cytochrome c peroxidase [Aestuariibaculum lutulentum]MCH4552353.1 cytochrome-c peroxidase [Aestuariibaculum lutulentum]